MRFFNPLTVWSVPPVATRTVEVNTKTGFSLTAGSYSVRASSTQTGNFNINAATTNTATISSVTTTRASLEFQGCSASGTTFGEAISQLQLTNATTVTGTKITSANGSQPSWQVTELF